MGETGLGWIVWLTRSVPDHPKAAKALGRKVQNFDIQLWRIAAANCHAR